jgi:hypothetical protein
MYAAAEQWRFLAGEMYYFTKIFDEDLPQDHPKNYYMEREWRLVGTPSRAQLNFSLDQVNAVMEPWTFRFALLNEFPMLANRLIRPRS